MLNATSTNLWSSPQVHRYLSAMRNEALVYMLLQIIDCKWQCNFMIKNLSCNFGCMLLERSLIKSVILLAYILYWPKKYPPRGWAYFVVSVGMIFKYTSFPERLPVVLVHPYVQTRSHKLLVNLSTNVDSKLAEKGL